jgi:hypothetical protein
MGNEGNLVFLLGVIPTTFAPPIEGVDKAKGVKLAVISLFEKFESTPWPSFLHSIDLA